MSGLKKNLCCLPVEQKRQLIEVNASLSQRQQCKLIGLSWSSLHYRPVPVSVETLQLMHRIDELFTAYPFYGSRKLLEELQAEGFVVGRDRIRSLMRTMGLAAIYPKPRLSQANPAHKTYPYLLRNVKIQAVNQVWSTDITYIRMAHGFMYLVAVMDWYSRYVLSWRLSNSLSVLFCIEALQEALQQATPSIFNTDQGSQFTSCEFLAVLEAAQIQISMDGRGRALDNVFIERLWRSVKYEHVYLHSYETVRELQEGLGTYFEFYNHIRRHQALGYLRPYEVYRA